MSRESPFSSPPPLEKKGLLPLTPLLNQIKSLLDQFEYMRISPTDSKKLQRSIRELLIQTHPDHNPNDPRMTEVGKVLTQLYATVNNPEKTDLKQLQNIRKLLNNLYLAEVASEPSTPMSHLYNEPEAPEPHEAKQETKNNESPRKDETDPEYVNFAPENIDEAKNHVEKLFNHLAERHRDYGSRFTIEEAMARFCQQIADKVKGHETDISSLRITDVTSVFSNPSGFDHEGNLTGDVIFMGKKIGNWDSMSDGYAFTLRFGEQHFNDAYKKFLDLIKKQKDNV